MTISADLFTKRNGKVNASNKMCIGIFVEIELYQFPHFEKCYWNLSCICAVRVLKIKPSNWFSMLSLYQTISIFCNKFVWLDTRNIPQYIITYVYYFKLSREEKTKKLLGQKNKSKKSSIYHGEKYIEKIQISERILRKLD